MENIRYQYVYNRKKTLNKEGKALIQLKIYIYAGGKAQNYYLSTGIYIAPNEWNEKERIIKRNENQKALNQQLSSLVNMLQSAEIEQRRKGKDVTFEFLKQVAENRHTENFLPFCENELRLQMLKDATKNNHLATFEKLRQYETKYKVLTFSDINLSFLESFEKWCKETALSQNSLIRHLQVIKAYFNRAINKDVIDAKFYPFRKYKLKSTKTSIPFLEKNEVQLLENLDMSQFSAQQKNILEMFLFACYTGLRFADIQNVKNEDIKQINGEHFLSLYASKTEKETRISLDIFEGKALKIAQRNISNDKPTIFCSVSNAYVNTQLKNIAKKAGITKNVHFHVSRHTFATTLVNAKISLVSVQKLLGHSDIKTTQIYAEMLDDTIHNELKNSNL